MPTLLHLPNETLYCITDAVDYADFESFSLVCKDIYAIADPRRMEHNELRRRYKDIQWEGRPRGNLVALIRDVWESPGIGYFVKRFSFLADGEEILKFEALSEAVSTAQYVQYSVNYESNIAAGRSGGTTRAGLLLALFLPLLPNLEILTLTHPHQYLSFYEPLMDIMRAKQLENPASAPLRKLKEIQMVSRGRYVSENKLLYLEPFIFLPFLKKIRSIGNSIESKTVEEFGGINSRWIRDKSAAEEIEMLGVIVRIEQFPNILQPFSNLKHMVAEITFNGGSDRYARFIAILAEKCPSLKSLDLKLRGPAKKEVGSFQPLRRLKSLRVDVCLILGYSGLGSTSEMFAVPLLTNILPPTLETLHLYAGALEPSKYEDLFLHLGDTRATLPNLKKVKLVSRLGTESGAWSQIENECRRAGVHLSIVQTQFWNYHWPNPYGRKFYDD